ncbi:hypothetical protein [Allocoleopsis sp.]|uniref:hypothetical protein n=1 Tax=Allocoleopsis sp. TaxID=3088169 RepID=UPI002FD58181
MSQYGVFNIAKPIPIPIPDSNIAKPKSISGINVAAGKPVIAKTGGIIYPDWGNANDLVDYKTYW